MTEGRDVCVHIAPPEQSMCTCREYIEWQRGIISLQMQRILDLERRLRGEPIRRITELVRDAEE